MASSLFTTTATLLPASSTVVPKFSPPKNPNFITPLILLHSSSPNFNSPYVFCFKFRAYAVSDSDSSNNVDADEDDYAAKGDEIEQEAFDDGVEIKIEKIGKNSRRIRSKVAVQASLGTLWNILTDYERLAEFIPGLAVSQLLEKRDKFARLYQIGEQNLAFGLKFNAKGTIDCFEKELEDIPFGQRRDIEFRMVEGDFQLFEGKWSVEQEMKCSTGDSQGDAHADQEFQTFLIYVVEVKPKLWLPVRLVEGRLCREIRTNLSCIRDEAEKAFEKSQTAL